MANTKIEGASNKMDENINSILTPMKTRTVESSKLFASFEKNSSSVDSTKAKAAVIQQQ